MELRLTIRIPVDRAYVAREATRRGEPSEQIVRELAGECENALHDSVRHKDGVAIGEPIRSSILVESCPSK